MERSVSAPAPIFYSVNAGRKSPAGLLRQMAGAVGMGLLVLLLASMELSLWASRLPQPFAGFYATDTGAVAVDACLYAAAFALAYYVLRAATGLSGAAALPWEKGRGAAALPAVFFGLGLSTAGAFFMQMLNETLADGAGVRATLPDFRQPGDAVGWVLYFVSMAVLPAVLEEAVFRGVVLGALRQFGDRFAVVASAVLFAFVHGNLLQGANAFFMGLLLAALAVHTGSLKTSMFLHFANNFYSCLIGAADTLSGGLPDLFYIAVFAAPLLLGGAGLGVLIWRFGELFRPARGSYPLRGAHKAFCLVTAPMMALYLAVCLAFVVMYFAPVAQPL